MQGKLPEEELLKHKLTVARALIASKRLSKKQIERFLYFLQQFVHIGDEEINHKFDKEIDQLTGKRNAMGIIETIKMLEREERWKLILKLHNQYSTTDTSFCRLLTDQPGTLSL